MRPEFTSEASLVKHFLRALKRGVSPWGQLDIATEWDYRAGRTDVLVRTKDRALIAFEAKLKDWRRASLQAYRNTTFARRVYVVMPYTRAAKAAEKAERFLQYGVGLCAVQAESIQVLIEGPDCEALLPWVASRAHGYFDGRPHVRNRSRAAGRAGTLRPRPA